MSKIACIVNPVSRHHERAWKLVQQHCAALGFAPPTRYETTMEHSGGLQATQALESGYDSMIAIGGDGTVRNIGNVPNGSEVPLGIVPMGTANIFHLNVVGKSKSLDQAVRTAILGQAIPVDLGRVQLQFDDHRADWEGHFLVVVGVGHDAEALARVSPTLKRRIGAAAYFVAGARQLLGKPLPLTIEIDGDTVPDAAVWSILVGNCGVVPGGITILPGANVQDGLLNVLRIAPSSLPGWLPIAWRGWRGSTRELRHLTDGTARQVTINSDHPVSVQIDGDVWSGISAIEIGIEPAALLIRSRSSERNDHGAASNRDSTIDSRLDGSV